MKQFIFATAVLMSTIVGVGMFSLPYSGAQSGFLVAAIFLIILTGVILFLHLLYGEIVARTKEKHRLTGYAGYYLGNWGKGIVAISVVIGFIGSLLVYIIVGGEFLHIVLSSFINISPMVLNIVFFVIGSIVVYFGLRLIAGLDFLMSLFLILIVFLFLFFGVDKIDFNNFKGFNLKGIFYPYGVILYAITGMAAIPEIREMISNKSKYYKKAIIWGTLIPGVLYLIFMWVVIGLTGSETSPEAISGLTNLLGKKVVILGSLFGFLATITSFFIIGLSLKNTFIYDFKINKNLSWFLVCFTPFLLFLLGIQSFVTIIAVLGALLGAIEGSAVILIYKKAKKFGNQVPEYSLKAPGILRYTIIAMLFIGFIATVLIIV